MNASTDEALALDGNERRLLVQMQQARPRDYLMFELAALGPALLLGVLGLVHDSDFAIVAALGAILTFRIVSLRSQLEDHAVWASLLNKLCLRAGVEPLPRDVRD
jgi:hypothetical protein